MCVERSAARRGITGWSHAEPGSGQHVEASAVHLALHGVHDTSREEVHVVAGRLQLRLSKRDLLRHAEARRHYSQLLGNGKGARSCVEKFGIRERFHRESLPSGGHEMFVGQRLAGRLHQLSERHIRRTRRFAAPALHTRRKRIEYLGGDRRIVNLDFAHQLDTAPRRHHLVARHAKGGTEREAQTALNTGVEIVGVDVEFHAVLLRSRIAAGIEPAGRVELLFDPLRHGERPPGSSGRLAAASRRTPIPAPPSRQTHRCQRPRCRLGPARQHRRDSTTIDAEEVAGRRRLR